MGYADARRLEPEHSEHRTSLVSPPPHPTFCLHLPRGNGPPGRSSPYRRAENDQREPPTPDTVTSVCGGSNAAPGCPGIP